MNAPISEALARVVAYLNELDRIDGAKKQYPDEVHGVNDLPLRRSDLRVLTAALPAEVAEQIAQAIEAGVLPTHPNRGFRDGMHRASLIAREAGR